MSSYPTDCLVLKIEERVCSTKELDTTLYVLYDTRENNFVIRGLRTPSKSCKNDSPRPYSYTCETLHNAEFFISFVISDKNLWTYELYNYDDLPDESHEITYDYLNVRATLDREISAYDNTIYKKEMLHSCLSMLREVNNPY
jgi:hypothetical protein